jgi:putative hydrolase of the HAD superfamily
MGYKNVFIDLDRTLWDFETNSAETFHEIFHKYKLDKVCEFDNFYSVYREINDKLWREYRNKLIEKDTLSWKRFFLSMQHFGCGDEETARLMANDYISISPQKTRLFPGTIELLQFLSSKYRVYLVTNGFKEVQYNKIKNCKIDLYFDKVFTSEEVGCNKPNIEYFQFVLAQTNSLPEQSIIIGDDIEVDIKGAAQVGISTIWCNFVEQTSDFTPDYEVKSLLDILQIL